MSSSRKGEVFVLIILIAIMIGAGYLFWLGYHEGPQGLGEAVGTVVSVDRTAERRSLRSARWFRADSAALVYNRDTVRTGPRSEAVIKLDDGTELLIGEDSMVVIDITRETEISLASGSIRVSSSGMGRPVHLISDDGETLLSGGVLRLERKDGRSSISLERGSAEFHPASEHPGQAALLQQGARYEASSGSLARLEGDEALTAPFGQDLIAVSTVYPKGQELFASDYPHPQPFRWTPAGPGVRYRLRVWHERQEEALYERNSTRNEILLELPFPGVYRWEVELLVGGEQDPDSQSPPVGESRTASASFSLRSGTLPPPVLNVVSTLPGAHAEGLPLLRWENIPGAASWQVDIFDASDPQKRLFSRTVPRNAFHRDDAMGPGAWLVTVRGMTKGSILGESAGETLVLNPFMNLKLLSPSSGASVSGDSFFSWEDPNGGTRFRLRISAREDLADPVLDTIVRGSGSRVQMLDFPEGRWFWAVELIDSENNPLARSAVSWIIRPPPLPTPVLRSPIQGAQIDPAKIDFLLFSWDPVPGADSYELRVRKQTSKDDSLVLLVNPRGTQYRLDDLSAFSFDRFIWSLTAIGSSTSGREGRSESVQASFFFYEEELLAVPRITLMEKKGLY